MAYNIIYLSYFLLMNCLCKYRVSFKIRLLYKWKLSNLNYYVGPISIRETFTRVGDARLLNRTCCGGLILQFIVLKKVSSQHWTHLKQLHEVIILWKRFDLSDSWSFTGTPTDIYKSTISNSSRVVRQNFLSGLDNVLLKLPITFSFPFCIWEWIQRNVNVTRMVSRIHFFSVLGCLSILSVVNTILKGSNAVWYLWQETNVLFCKLGLSVGNLSKSYDNSPVISTQSKDFIKGLTENDYGIKVHDTCLLRQILQKYFHQMLEDFMCFP